MVLFDIGAKYIKNMNNFSKFILIISATIVMTSCAGGEKTVDAAMGKIENLAQLGTVEYTITKLIIANDEAFYKFGDRKVIFSCKAILKAGVDMKDFAKEDVQINDKSITVNLPEPIILSMDMPAEAIKCEYMKVGMLRQDFTTEERNALLIQGEEAIRGDIASYGIIEKAKENATIFFESLFRQSGFETVNIVFTPNR